MFFINVYTVIERIDFLRIRALYPEAQCFIERVRAIRGLFVTRVIYSASNHRHPCYLSCHAWQAPDKISLWQTVMKATPSTESVYIPCLMLIITSGSFVLYERNKGVEGRPMRVGQVLQVVNTNDMAREGNRYAAIEIEQYLRELVAIML